VRLTIVRTRLGVLDVAADERNGRWRQALAFLVAGVVVAAAVGLFWIVTEGGRTSSTADDATTAIEVPAPWDGARLGRNRLTLYFTGARPLQADDPCSRAYEAVAEPTDDMMVVTVRALAGSPLPPGQGCEDIGYDRSVTVDLPEPLEGRPVVDGASGQQRTVSNAAELLTPSWLPAGYHLSWEYVNSEIDTYIDRREWVVDGQPDVRLLVEQGDVDEVGRPGLDPVVLDRSTVRGMPATVWKTKGFDDLVCVSWAERLCGPPCVLERHPGPATAQPRADPRSR
jgi:hypothetical protein